MKKLELDQGFAIVGSGYESAAATFVFFGVMVYGPTDLTRMGPSKREGPMVLCSLFFLLFFVVLSVRTIATLGRIASFLTWTSPPLLSGVLIHRHPTDW